MRSNGLPDQLAHPGTSDFDFSSTVIGGTDFTEFISLTKRHGHTTLIQEIRTRASHGGILTMNVHTDGTFDIKFSNTEIP